MLVEDEEPAITLVQQAVSSFFGAFHLAVVADSVSCLDWLAVETANRHPLPRLILLDLKLPKLLGLAVLRTLRMDGRLSSVPIVVYSQLHDPADVVLAYQIGANSFVEKPQDKESFLRLFEELQALGWLQHRAIQPSIVEP